MSTMGLYRIVINIMGFFVLVLVREFVRGSQEWAMADYQTHDQVRTWRDE